MGNYFLVEVKPTIPGSKQDDGDYADGNLLFDWFAFDIPRGGAKLVSAQMIIRGTNGATQGAADAHYELYFAKTINGDAPLTMGTPHAGAAGSQYYNHIIGGLRVNDSELLTITKLHMMANNGLGDMGLPLVLQGEPNSGSANGFDKIYVAAGIQDGDLNFSTGIFTTESVEGTDGTISTITVDDDSGGSCQASRRIAPGDELITESDIVLGTLKSVTDTELTLESPMTGGDLVDSLQILVRTPITLQLGFEA